MTTFDVAVVGAGPAGAAAALTLAEAGRSVVLVGRAERRGCRAGEVLSPEIASILVQLGVWQPFLASGPEPSSGVWSAWGGDQVVMAKDLVASAYGPGWRVDRERFDLMLLDAVRATGAQTAVGLRRVEMHPVADGWRIDGAGTCEKLSVTAQFIVDATGRAAAVARAAGARWVSRDKLVALIGVLSPGADPDADADADGATVGQDVLLIESTAEGWWYSTVVPGGDLVATLLTDADLVRDGVAPPAQAWAQALAVAELTAWRVAGCVRRSFHVRVASVGCLDAAAGPNWVAVGDAASTIDPLSGVGIAKALRSAIVAARAVDDALAGGVHALGAYADRVQKEFDASVRMAQEYYRTERRWPASPFWRRRQHYNH